MYFYIFLFPISYFLFSYFYIFLLIEYFIFLDFIFLYLGAVGILVGNVLLGLPPPDPFACVGIEKDPRVISLPSNQPPIWLNITEYKPDWHILPQSDLQYVYRAAFRVATLVDQWIWSCCIWLVATCIHPKSWGSWGLNPANFWGFSAKFLAESPELLKFVLC